MKESWTLHAPLGRQRGDVEELLDREWLVTNGLGGYASGTLAGVGTRRYHSFLTAALPAPLGRQVLCNHLTETIQLPNGRSYCFGGREIVGGKLDLHGVEHLQEFRLDNGLPVWRYALEEVVFEKQILLPYRQNTTHIRYRLLQGPPIRLEIRLALHFRSHDAPVGGQRIEPYRVLAEGPHYEIQGPVPFPPLRFYLYGSNPAFTLEEQHLAEIFYRIEQRRGYDAHGDLWSPGYFRTRLSAQQQTTLVASTEPWEVILALNPEQAYQAEMERRQKLIAQAPLVARSDAARQLVLAADQFICTPAGRVQDAARAQAAGDEVRSVIAGYHWFTDWGRDTMISLEGLSLTTGRHAEAGFILRTFAQYVRDGLIPNMFPEGENEGLYHTADATLWFFYALDRYLEVTDDQLTLQLLLPTLSAIVEHHLRGTRFGIGVDPQDGLLRQGEAGYQLTWMDAKVDDWVVTPRRGKAVEINALWYNALCTMRKWLLQEDREADAALLEKHAAEVAESFNQRFWSQELGYLYDVVDGPHGDDPACRPNQILALSLPHAVLRREYWQPVLQTVQRRLLTPMGLRTLDPEHPDYKPNYYGDLRSRDAAYHQGTVWPWLLGPFVDAWLKVYPEDVASAKGFLQPLIEKHLTEACVGSISEIFDAQEPCVPRGCVAQAWSVAEVLRCWVKLANLQSNTQQ